MTQKYHVIHLSAIAVQQLNHDVTLYCVNRTSVKRLLQHAVQCEGVKTLAVHCHIDVCSAAGRHSAGCRKSPVCLQHYAMCWHLMVLQYVTASFHLPSVSTANTNTMQNCRAIWNTNNPNSCDIQGAASSVQHHGSLCLQLQQSSLLCLSRPANIQQSQIHKFYSITSIATCF